MFPILGAPANPDLVTRWRILSGVSAGGSGLASIGAVTGRLKEVFPEGMIIEQFTYIALAISFICGMFLFLVKKVVTVGLAQIGTVTVISLST